MFGRGPGIGWGVYAERQCSECGASFKPAVPKALTCSAKCSRERSTKRTKAKSAKRKARAIAMEAKR